MVRTFARAVGICARAMSLFLRAHVLRRRRSARLRRLVSIVLPADDGLESWCSARERSCAVRVNDSARGGLRGECRDARVSGRLRKRRHRRVARGR